MARVMRGVLIGLVVLAWVPLAAVTVARILGGGRTPFTQLASFTPLAAAGWLLALLLLVMVRAWRWAVLPLVVVLLHGFWFVQPVWTAFRAPEPATGTPVSLLALNTQYGGADAAAAAALVARDAVDVVAVQELTPDFARRFDAEVRGRLPYRVINAEADSAAGSGIWSRWPVRDLGGLPMGFHNAQGDVEVPGVGTVRVTSVHTLSPVPSRVPGWRDDFAVLADRARSGGTQIMLGDFNATRDHRPFRTLLEPMSDAAEIARPQPWRGPTWPVGYRWVSPVLRLDHVLVTKGAAGVTSSRVTDVPGTDHRALLVKLVLRPA
jgi:endonuclease/exonuclease/phosphatase family metal-dependent hydrolase